MVDTPSIPCDEPAHELSEGLVMFIVEVGKGCFVSVILVLTTLSLRPCPFRHPAESSDDCQALVLRMADHYVAVMPAEFILLWLDVGPGEVLHDPRRSHASYHPQSALDLPCLYLVGEASVDAGDGVRGDHLLWRIEDDEDLWGADGPQDKDRQKHADQVGGFDVTHLSESPGSEIPPTGSAEQRLVALGWVKRWHKQT